MKKFYIIGASLFILSACNQNSLTDKETINNEVAQTSIIAPPFEGDFVNDATFKIDPTKENTVATPNGSSFTIPENALVNANGDLIKEEVTVNFKQYHSLADILSSGIPMEYDTLGEECSFQSAGMFTLNAQTQNETVFLKYDQEIAMHLASDKSNETPYNFYSLNENTGDWTYEHSETKLAGNPRFDPAVIPQEPEAVSEDAFILDVNFDLSEYEELSAFTGIVWEYSGDADSLDPRKNKSMSRVNWSKFDLEATGESAYEYFMTMSKGALKFTTRVKAALDGTNLDLAMQQYAAKKVATEKKMEELQKPYIRSVNFSGFGTYNYDYIHRIKKPANFVADFDFGEQNHLKEGCMVVVIYEKDDFLVNYPIDKWPQFGLNTKRKAKILAILPDNQVAVYRGDPSVTYDKEEYTFKMDVLEQKLDSKNDLIDVIASI